MTRRIRREDPAYLAAMREAKVLFEAEMAKSAMKGRGRPAKTAVTAEPIADDVDLSDVTLEIVSVTDDEGAEEEKEEEEKDEEDADEAEEDAEPVKKPAKASAKKAPKKAVAKKEKATAARRPSKPAARKR